MSPGDVASSVTVSPARIGNHPSPPSQKQQRGRTQGRGRTDESALPPAIADIRPGTPDRHLARDRPHKLGPCVGFLHFARRRIRVPGELRLCARQNPEEIRRGGGGDCLATWRLAASVLTKGEVESGAWSRSRQSCLVEEVGKGSRQELQAERVPERRWPRARLGRFSRVKCEGFPRSKPCKGCWVQPHDGSSWM